MSELTTTVLSRWEWCNITRSQLTSFHLNWVRSDWSQPRRTGSLLADSTRPISSQLRWGCTV